MSLMFVGEPIWIFGFNLMSIWSNAASSNDINAVDVSTERGLVVTADDEGYINLLNYPRLVRLVN